MGTCCNEFHATHNLFRLHLHNFHGEVEAKHFQCPGHPLDSNGKPEQGCKLKNITFRSFVSAFGHEKGCSRYLQFITDFVGEVFPAEIVEDNSGVNKE